MDSSSDQLIQQRVRNRLTEVCHWIVEQEVGLIDLNELINSWYDFWIDERPDLYGDPVYSPSETRLLTKVAESMENLCNVTPNTIPSDPESLKALFKLSEWLALKRTAKIALDELHLRGRFSEDFEETF